MPGEKRQLWEAQRDAVRIDFNKAQREAEKLTDKVKALEQQTTDLVNANEENTRALATVQAENEHLTEEKEALLQKFMQLKDEQVHHLMTIADLKGQLSAGEDLRSQVETLRRTVSELVMKDKNRK